MTAEAIAVSEEKDFLKNIFYFVDELRLAGYNIGAGQYIAAQELLIKLAREGNLPRNPDKLRSILSPLFCNSPQEQEDFGFRFERWREHFMDLFKEQFEAEAPEKKPEAVVEIEKELETIQKRSRKMTWAVTGVATVIALIASLAYFMNLPTVKQPVIEGGQPKTQEEFPPDIGRSPKTAGEKFQISTEIYVGSLLGLLVCAIIGRRIWWHYIAKRYLARRSIKEEPDVHQFFVRSHASQLFNSISLFRTAQEFRKYRWVQTQRLDVDKTVEESTRRAGWFTPVEGYRRTLPEYLVLIDRATYRDHQAEYIDAMIDRLKENDVFLTRYYFDSDPRSCYPEKGGFEPLNLLELADLYHDHRLLIFSDGAGLTDPFTGELSSWIEQFSAWDKRAFLTLESTNNWDTLEQSLIGADFMVMPASETGLAALIDQVNINVVDRKKTASFGKQFPPLLRDFPRRWLEDEEPDPVTVSMLLSQVKTFLDDDCYTWFSACAIYPELSWNLTLYLGFNVKTDNQMPLLNEDRLAKLARLPWFRYGRMPDWLRGRLIKDLPIKQDRKIRQALYQLFITAIDQPVDGFKLEYAQEKGTVLSQVARRVLARISKNAKPNSRMRDHVFLTFMSNSLAVSVPRMVNKVFRKTAVTPEPTEARAADPATRMWASMVQARMQKSIKVLIPLACAILPLSGLAFVLAPDSFDRQFIFNVLPAFGLVLGLGVTLTLIGYSINRKTILSLGLLCIFPGMVLLYSTINFADYDAFEGFFKNFVESHWLRNCLLYSTLTLAAAIAARRWKIVYPKPGRLLKLWMSARVIVVFVFLLCIPRWLFVYTKDTEGFVSYTTGISLFGVSLAAYLLGYLTKHTLAFRIGGINTAFAVLATLSGFLIQSQRSVFNPVLVLSAVYIVAILPFAIKAWRQKLPTAGIDVPAAETRVVQLLTTTGARILFALPIGILGIQAILGNDFGLVSQSALGIPGNVFTMSVGACFVAISLSIIFQKKAKYAAILLAVILGLFVVINFFSILF